MSKLLLICYSFPPHPGIGGRRWTKFSKFLASKHNLEIDVINAINYSNKESFWLNDIKDSPRINIYSFHFQFQRILLNPNSILDKIFRKILIYISKFSKFSPSFITSFPNKKLWNFIQNKIHNNSYSSVIVSGDPFLFYYSSILKLPSNCNLILDYRDLWNDHSFYSKNVSLTKKQTAFFSYAENYSVNHCAKIFFVDKHIESVIKQRITNNTPTFVFNNGFDSSDYSSALISSGTSEFIKLFFAGSISSDLNFRIISFLKVLKNYNLISNKKVHLNIFGNFDEEVSDELINNESHFIFYKQELSYNDYIKELANSDIGLIILSNEYLNSFTTKFSDYIALNKYVLCIGESGEFSEFIYQNRIGSLFNSSSDTDFFNELINNFNNRHFLSDNIKLQFDIGNITQKLVSEL